MPLPNFKELQTEYDKLTQELTNPELISQWEKFQELAKRRSTLEKILETQKNIEEVQQQIEENSQILSAPEDSELSAMASQELLQLTEKKNEMGKQLEKFLKRDEEELPNALIMEIRPGTGGDEASLFAKDLLNMYTRYAEAAGWKVTLMESSTTEVGGVREAVLEIAGSDALEKLRHEAGVHRIQRIPSTEKAGRVHTSTASVAVLAKPKATRSKIDAKDLKTDLYNSSGPGGQNVNKRKTAVRITHLPTGTIAAIQSSRSQQKNREFAMVLLEAKLQQLAQEEAKGDLAGTRKKQIGSSERAEKIRTYNIPQDRVTDHRIKESWSNVERILGGNLGEITNALSAEETA